MTKFELTDSESGPLGEDDGAPPPMGVDHERDGGDGGEAATDHHYESHDPGAGQSPVDLALLFPSVHGEAGEKDAYPRVACKKIICF